MVYLYLGIVLGSLSFLSLCIVLFLFWIKRVMLIKENNIKNFFNDFVLVDIDKKIILMDNLGFSNSKYEGISDFFLEYRSKFEDSVLEIRKKIFSLINANKFFDWKNFNLIYKSLEKDLSNLKNSLINAEKLIEETFEYRDYISKVIINYRDCSKRIISFYESNLGMTFDNSQIVSLINEIRNNNLAINNFFEPESLEFIIETFKSFNKSLINFTNFIENLYVLDKENKYINYSIGEINEFLNSKSNKINSSNINKANKVLTKINSSILVLKNKIDIFDFESISKISNHIIKELVEIKKVLQLDFSSSEFFSENKNSLLEIISIFKNSYKKINSSLIKMRDNFSKDTIFLEEIDKEIFKLKELLDALIKVENEINSNFNSSHLIVVAKNSISQISYWIESCEVLTKSAILKYKYFKIVMNEISSNKLLVAQLLVFLKKSNFRSEFYTNNILALKNRLNRIENNILSDYNANFEYFYNLLTDAKEEIYLLSQDFIRLFIAKTYIEKMIWFINLKSFEKNKNNIDLTLVMKFYRNGEYQKGISEAWKILKNFN